MDLEDWDHALREGKDQEKDSATGMIRHEDQGCSPSPSNQMGPQWSIIASLKRKKNIIFKLTQKLNFLSHQSRFTFAPVGFSSATQDFSSKSAAVLNLSRLVDIFLEGIPCVSNWYKCKVDNFCSCLVLQLKAVSSLLLNIKNISVCKLLSPLEI